MTSDEALAKLSQAVLAATNMAAKAQSESLLLQTIVAQLLAEVCRTKPQPAQALSELLASLEGQIDGLTRQAPSSGISFAMTEAMLRISEAAELTVSQFTNSEIYCPTSRV